MATEKNRKCNQPHKKNRTISKKKHIQHDCGAQSTTPDMPSHETHMKEQKKYFCQI